MRKTVIIVTHDMGEAFALGDRVGVLDEGRLGRLRSTERAIAASTARAAPVRRDLGRGDPIPEAESYARARSAEMTPFSARPKWLSHRAELAALFAQHVLAGVDRDVAVAVAIGVPLGIFAARRPRLGAPLVGLANIVQTVPSLAMFGFLLPVPLIGGVGARGGSSCSSCTACCRSCARRSPG